MKMPSIAFSSIFDNGAESPYEDMDGQSIQLQASLAEQTYLSVRRARSENGIVLQVDGDDEPIRVLPLPPGAKSVFVSDLLTQTGVQQKFTYVEATLYRHSVDSIGGLPMEVRMADHGQEVRPESDYALRAGDRLHVRKAPNPALQGLLNTVLGQ